MGRRQLRRFARIENREKVVHRHHGRVQPRKLSSIAPDWWDYTTLDDEISRRRRRGSRPKTMLELSRPGFQRRLLRHARGLLSGRGARVHRRLAAIHGRQPGRASAGRSGRPSNCRWWRGSSTSLDLTLHDRPISGAWTNGSIDGQRSAGDASASFERADRELCFNRIDRELRMPDAEPAFPEGRHRPRTRESWDERPLRRDARRPGRSEALGVQRSAAARRQVQGRAARRRPSIASCATRVGRPAPDDDHPKRPHLRRRQRRDRCRRRRSASARWKPGRPRRSPSGTPATHDNPFGQRLTDADDLQAIARQRPCRCRCWPIIPTCSSITTAAGIGTCDVEMH